MKNVIKLWRGVLELEPLLKMKWVKKNFPKKQTRDKILKENTEKMMRENKYKY